VQLYRVRSAIRDAGAELVLVGNGARHFARAFRDDLRLETPVYVDTERRAYAALGMRRGLGSALGVASTLKSAARAYRAGFRQGAVQGDAWQLGGVLVVRPGGEIAYRHLSKAAGDHPQAEDVLAALRD
jgi:hypothetical protein